MRYQSNRPKRQFLAGVTCPQCQTLDVVVQVQVFKPKFDEYIQCTQCGHIEHRPQANDLKGKIKSQTNDEQSTNVITSVSAQNKPIIVDAGIAVANITE